MRIRLEVLLVAAAAFDHPQWRLVLQILAVDLLAVDLLAVVVAVVVGQLALLCVHLPHGIHHAELLLAILRRYTCTSSNSSCILHTEDRCCRCEKSSSCARPIVAMQ